jgi:hypothetical protein
MISLYAGRLMLVCTCSSRNWQAHVVLGPKADMQVKADTGTVHLPTALERAQSIYRMAVTQLRPEGAPRMCWDCLQWDMRKQGCDLQLPEAKRSGGRYAPRCEMFEPAIAERP